MQGPVPPLSKRAWPPRAEDRRPFDRSGEAIDLRAPRLPRRRIARIVQIRRHLHRVVPRHLDIQTRRIEADSFGQNGFLIDVVRRGEGKVLAGRIVLLRVLAAVHRRPTGAFAGQRSHFMVTEDATVASVASRLRMGRAMVALVVHGDLAVTGPTVTGIVTRHQLGETLSQAADLFGGP